MTTPVVPQTLYHYTCLDHGHPGIKVANILRPWPQPMLAGHPLVWLTDLDPPDAWALGLTNHTLCCSRTEVRALVKPHDHADQCGIQPWWHFARKLTRTIREVLEETGLPMHWWISEQPVCVDTLTVIRPRAVQELT